MFHVRLKKLREQQNISREHLAKSLDITYSALSKYEAGTRNPDFETLQKIADYFEVSTDHLLGRDQKSSVQQEINSDYEEFREFMSNPNNNIHFKEMLESPDELLDKLWEYWDFIKKSQK